MIFNFELDVPSNIKVSQNRIEDLLINNGFSLKSSADNLMVFRQGSNLRNYFTFNPKKWKTQINIEFLKTSEHSTNIKTNIYVSTKGQIVTPKEEEYWIQFTENIKKSLIDKVDFNELNNELSQRAYRRNWEYIKWAIIGFIIFFPIGLLIGYLFETTGIASLIVITGGMGILFYKINKDKKEMKNG